MTDGVNTFAASHIRTPTPIDVARSPAAPRKTSGGIATQKGATPTAPSEPRLPAMPDAAAAERSAIAVVKAFEAEFMELPGKLKAIGRSHHSPHDKAEMANEATDRVERLRRSAEQAAKINLQVQKQVRQERWTAGVEAHRLYKVAGTNPTDEARKKYDLAVQACIKADEQLRDAVELLDRAQKTHDWRREI